MKHLFLILVLFVTVCGFNSPKKANQSLNQPLYGSTIDMKVSELALLHSEVEIITHPSYAKIKALSDANLKLACTAPLDGDYVTIKKGTKVVMQGNTRIYEMKRRGFLDFVVTCDQYAPPPLSDYGFYDL